MGRRVCAEEFKPPSPDDWESGRERSGRSTGLYRHHTAKRSDRLGDGIWTCRGQDRTHGHSRADGLVQAFLRQGVLISQGEARRIDPADDSTPQTIPVASRDTLLGNRPLGVELLRGVVRLRDSSSPIVLRQSIC